MRTAVESIIFFYLFICVALLVFNLLYIFRSVLMERSREARIRRWEQRRQCHGQRQLCLAGYQLSCNQ